MWKKFCTLCLTILFPPWCCHCGRLGSLLCPHCFQQITWNKVLPPLPELSPIIDQVVVAGPYEGVLGSLIKTLKYESVIEVGPILGELLYLTCQIPPADAITFVPIHRRKLQIRGFNQAEVIAQTLARLSQLPLVPLLHKIRPTPAQATTNSKSERLEAFSQPTFQVHPSQIANQLPQRVLLLDDVLTTGATLTACAKVLKQAGVQTVSVITVAHGS